MTMHGINASMDNVLHDEMPFSMFSDWYYLILGNDGVQIRRYLDSVNEEDRRRLLTGRFVYEGESPKAVCEFQRPLYLAVATLSWRSLDILLQEKYRHFHTRL